MEDETELTQTFKNALKELMKKDFVKVVPKTKCYLATSLGRGVSESGFNPTEVCACKAGSYTFNINVCTNLHTLL